MENTVVNKYGKTVNLSMKTGNGLERDIEDSLKIAKVNYTTQYAFDEKGLRRIKYDFAILNDDQKPVLFIEADGTCHYDEQFFIDQGTRPERAMAQLSRRCIADAEKDKIALEHGVPVLRIDNVKNLHIRILGYLWKFVEESPQETKEVSMIKMFDQYGWPFKYVIPSELSKEEETYLKGRFPEMFGGAHGTDE